METPEIGFSAKLFQEVKINKENRKKTFILLVFALVILADQFSKEIIQRRFAQNPEPIHVIGTYFNIVYVENPYGAMGLRFGPSWLHALTSSLATLLVGFYCFFNLFRKSSFFKNLGLFMVFAGALGNLADKILRTGGVIDFIDIGIGTKRFWAFNIADASITIGAVLWILFSSMKSKEVE
ncbi:signal peptidase II [candidate division WOR-3 bacterium]|nr:signal peptidase II [candidate division WOR-3 bacterium]